LTAFPAGQLARPGLLLLAKYLIGGKVRICSVRLGMNADLLK
jgi:hypothetical protein